MATNDDTYYIRTNGRGNAWPILLGSKNIPTNLKYEDLANTSLSIIKSKGEVSVENTEWDVLIDAGHGIVQSYLMKFNRIPETILITHPHHDHTYSIDWIAQSFYRLNQKNKRYPIYTSERCWQMVQQSYPQLSKIAQPHILKYGIPTKITEAKELEITAYPVYHGSSALGACMLLAQIDGKKVLFMGDVLCPLLRNIDYENLKNIDLVYVDTNNRYPHPQSNHWSICNDNSEAIKYWCTKNNWDNIFEPHISHSPENANYLNAVKNDIQKPENLYFTQFDFFAKIQPKQVQLVHYSGSEDLMYNEIEKLNQQELSDWANIQKTNYNCENIKFASPEVGNLIKL